MVLNGKNPSADLGEFKLKYCDIIRYKDKVKQYIIADLARKHLWDNNHVLLLMTSVRQALVARAVDMDHVDRIYYPNGGEQFVYNKNNNKPLPLPPTLGVGSSSSSNEFLYNCDQLIELKDDITHMTADQSSMTLFMNAVGTISYSNNLRVSKSVIYSNLNGRFNENYADGEVYYVPYNDDSNFNNPFLDVNFLSEVYTNFTINDVSVIHQNKFSENYRKYESFSSILWRILQKNNNDNTNINSINNSTNNMRGNYPLFIIYQSLNSESGGSLAMRQLYMDIQSLIVPFIISGNKDDRNPQENIAFYCDDMNVNHSLCTDPPDSSIVITGEWCSGVLLEHKARNFNGLGLQWFLGFHHRNDFCKGRVRIGHTRYLQNIMASSVLGGYYLGCSMNNLMKPYILDFLHKYQYQSVHEKNNGKSIHLIFICL